MTKLDRAERALWQGLAAEWDNYTADGITQHGLCNAIKQVTAAESDMRARMLARIERSQQKNYRGLYMWSLDAKGAKSRAAFCRRAAAALAKPATPRAGGR